MIELLVITPPDACPDADLVARWIDAGFGRVRGAVLFRAPGSTPAELVHRFGPWGAACRRHGIDVLLSCDLADAAEAARLVHEEGLRGLQLRGDPDESELRAVRRRWPALVLGRSCHGAPRAVETCADYTCVAPVFPPRHPSSRGKRPLGTAGLARWAECVPWVVALGGVAPHTATDCIAAGARGIASICSFLGAPHEVTENVRSLVATLEAARHVPRP